MNKIRTVQAVQLTVCKNGDIAAAGPPGPRMQYLNSCNHWCWLDAMYCSECGARATLEPLEQK